MQSCRNPGMLEPRLPARCDIRRLFWSYEITYYNCLLRILPILSSHFAGIPNSIITGFLPNWYMCTRIVITECVLGWFFFGQNHSLGCAKVLVVLLPLGIPVIFFFGKSNDYVSPKINLENFMGPRLKVEKLKLSDSFRQHVQKSA